MNDEKLHTDWGGVVTNIGTILEPCQNGDWSLETFDVSEDEAKWQRLKARLGGRMNFHLWYDFKPGTYWRLTHRGTVVMSNTPMEIRTNLEFMRKAQGIVTIAGLGMGVVLPQILPNVEQVNIIEKNLDVIGMINPLLANRLPGYSKKVRVINADIHDYINDHALSKSPFARTNVFYFDIWNEISGDNYPEMKTLKRKARKFLIPNANFTWVGCWMEDECRRLHKARMEWE